MYLIPHRSLFLLPLHATCWYDPQPGETEPTSAKAQRKTRPHYLLEDYVVIYAPSAYLLKVSQERQSPKPQQLRAMVVGNPLPLNDTPSLAFAVDEARAVSKQLRGASWEVNELIEIAGAPLQGMKSVVAAACLTSVTSPTLNEYLGMGAAFLQAGVGTFIGTIFPLSDAGSSQLVPELYRLHLQEGLSWADALRKAQLQMAGIAASSVSRDKRGPTTTAKDLEFLQDAKTEIPLDHPYHWAAFTVSGKE